MTLIKVCPFCDSPRVYYRAGSRGKKVTRGYHCESCNQRFKHPLERKRMSGAPRKGLAKKLCDMDPDEVPG